MIFSASDGEVLLKYLQDDPSDHVALEDVLKALGINEPAPSAPAAENKPHVVCEEDVCKIQK